MNAGDFWNKHAGQTCLIVAVGPNLPLTPPELFDYPSFSCNSIFMHEIWEPDYYVGVDQRLWDENAAKIQARYWERDTAIFLPSPDYDYIEGPNLVRFKHYRSSGYSVGGHMPTMKEALTTHGITYQRVMGAVFQIAYYMGFTRMLIIGMSHKPDDERSHFYGTDYGTIVNQPINHWFDEYRHWAHFGKAEVLNISADTYVPEDVIPRDDWNKYAKVE